MLASSHDVPTHGPVLSHRCAGVVHVVEVGGSLDSVLDAIRSELDDCDVHALVVDVARGLTVRGMDIDRIAGVLEDRGIDRLQIRLDQDGDGQSIVISLV